jgi:hypothetical protein
VISTVSHNFTIRAWSHLALRQTVSPVYMCRSPLHRRAHQPGLCPPPFAFPLESGSPNLLVTSDQVEVGPLSRGVMYPLGCAHGTTSRFNPYPPHYREIFAFSTIPYPQAHRLTLRFAFPRGRDHRETYGLTTFCASTCVG